MKRGRLAAVSLLLVLVVWVVSCSDDNPVRPTLASGPRPPSWLYVSATANDRITLRWDDVSVQEAGYQIERSPSGSDGSWTVIDSVALDTDVYMDHTVTDSSLYYYRLLAFDNIGRTGDPTEPVWARALDNHTPTSPSAPFPPSDSTRIEGPSITFGWTSTDSDAGDTIEYDVYFGQSQTGLTKVAAGILESSYVPPDELILTRAYFWRVVARDDKGATALSPIWNFGTRIEQVDVPAGYFFYGDCGRFYPEEPARFCSDQNPVYLDAFNIDRFEVSNQLYARFLQSLLDSLKLRVEEGVVMHRTDNIVFAEVYPDGDSDSGIEFFPHEGQRGLFVPRPGKENHPAVEVSWHGAQRYAQFMGRELPTQYQWEKAARGTSTLLGASTFTIIGPGDTTTVTVGLGFPYPWGEVLDSHRCNYRNSGDPFESTVGVATTPGGFYDGSSHSGYSTGSNESPYGIFDMAGNVAEWCRDQAFPNANQKVVRGGGWRSRATACLTFWRQESGTDSTDNALGFRTVGTPTMGEEK